MEIQVLASSSRGNCYHISDGRTPILLECGIPWKQIQQALNFRTSELAGCLVSHEHGDHSRAVKDVMKAGIDVYASKGTFDSLGLLTYRTCIIQETIQFNLGTWTILPFGTIHDAAEPLGFLLVSGNDRLLFATDTAYLKYRFNGLTHIMIEANYQTDVLRNNVEAGLVAPEMKGRIRRSHFDLENVKEFFKANDLSKVQEIYLLHLSDSNSDAELFKREMMELTGKMVFVA